MSLQALAWVFADVKGITATERLVLLGLANYADGDGVAWPSIRRLGEDLDLSPRSVQRAVTSLEESGLLVVEHRQREGAQISSLYRLPLLAPPPATVAPPPRHSGVPPLPQWRTNEPSIEPSIEPMAADAPLPGLPETKPKSTRGSRLPDGFVENTPHLLAVAAQVAPALQHPQIELDAFCDYWRSVPGAKGVKADWEATWRNWLRRKQSEAEAKGWRLPAPVPSVPDDGRKIVAPW